MKYLIILLLTFTMLQACSDRTLNQPETVLTEIHLQSGFFGQVTIWLDNNIVYDEFMSDSEPFAGPQSQFTLPMERGTTDIKVSWGATATQLINESSIVLGSSDEYFLGIRIVNKAATFKLQTSKFLYF